jgi:hypothetical protein
MSPRRNRARRDPIPEAGSSGAYEHVEDWNGEDWHVRSLRGSSSNKTYRCPGCDQEIRPATPHVVVWPVEPIVGAGVDVRRHWHSACWKARDRRRAR